MLVSDIHDSVLLESTLTSGNIIQTISRGGMIGL